MTPRYVVIHDTAGRDTKFSSVDWFASKQCGTSAHFVVERDGTITQMVATNKRAFHAGVSSWKGVSGLNSCSVGIEIVNPGKLDDKGNAWFGKAAEPKDIVRKSSPNHGMGYWLPYTPEQIAAVIAICQAVVEEYPDCNEIVTHWEIAPKRKIDTNPLFPLDELRQAVFDPTVGAVEHMSVPESVGPPIEPPEPTVLNEAARSWSVRIILGIIWGWVCDFFFGLGEWVSRGLDVVVAIATETAQETGAALMPLASLAGTLKLNLTKITLWVTIAFLCVVLARHVKDRVALKKIKQQLPEASP